jgi:hypothetical protein
MEQFEDETGVSSKEEGVLECNDVAFVIPVIQHYLLEDTDLHLGLIAKLWFVSDDLECTELLGLVIEGLENLTERTLTNYVQHLIPVQHGIVCRDGWVTVLIGELPDGTDAALPDEVDLLPAELLELEGGEPGVRTLGASLLGFGGVPDAVVAIVEVLWEI